MTSAPPKPVSVSVNMIHKGSTEPLLNALRSLHTFLRPGDEVIVVDTGCTDSQHRRLVRKVYKLFPRDGEVRGRVLDRRDLSVDYKPLIERFLDPPAHFEKLLHNGVKSVRGILSFAEARNVALDASTGDVILWLDSDDVLEEPQPGHLRKVVDHVFSPEKGKPLDALFMDYAYAHGPDGTVTCSLRRERIFKRGKFRWKGRCHETAIPTGDIDVQRNGFFQDVQARIRHVRAQSSRASDVRNYLILRTEFEEDPDAVDPRTITYLGNAARGLELYTEAMSYYRYFDYRSGSGEDRFNAHYNRGAICLDSRIRRLPDAYDAFMESVKVRPLDPRGYFGVSRVCLALCKFEECLHWYRIGTTYRMPDTQVMAYDPTHIDYHPHVIALQAAQEMGDVPNALEFAQRAHRARPAFPEAQELMKQTEMWARGQQIKMHLIGLHNEMPGGANRRRRLRELIEELPAVPPDVEKMGMGKLEPADGRADLPEIAIYCDGSPEPWGPLNRLEGTGGSEKMVIMLSEALQATGRCRVSVYAEVPFEQRGVLPSGVNWRHWSEFDESRPRHAFVGWRGTKHLVPLTVPARFHLLWLHDVQKPGAFSPELIASVDAIQGQSEFHLARAQIPADKKWIARNAIEPVPADFPTPPRDPFRVFYGSSPDRGLRTAIEVVRRAKKIEPRISLVAAYGWTPWARRLFAHNGSHGFVHDLGRDASFDLYEKDVYAGMEAVNGIMLHRVNFLQLAHLMRSSGVWLYPCRFDEISCMTAMEAQYHGCVPLTTNRAALAETVLPAARELCPPLPDLSRSGNVPDEWYEEAAYRLVEACRTAAEGRAALDAISAQALAAFNVTDLAETWLQRMGLGKEETTVLPSADPDSGGRDGEGSAIMAADEMSACAA